MDTTIKTKTPAKNPHTHPALHLKSKTPSHTSPIYPIQTRKHEKNFQKRTTLHDPSNAPQPANSPRSLRHSTLLLLALLALIPLALVAAVLTAAAGDACAAAGLISVILFRLCEVLRTACLWGLIMLARGFSRLFPWIWASLRRRLCS